MIARLLVAAVVVAAIAGILLWPRTYRVGETAGPIVVFWHDDEAFVFLSKSAVGQSTSPVQERLEGMRLGFVPLLFVDTGFFRPMGTAYRLDAGGTAERFALPKGSASYGSWSLHEGRLQLTAPPSPLADTSGFRWDGAGFIAVPPEPVPPSTETEEDDLADDLDARDDDVPAGFSPARRQEFKDAGWHYKMLTGYNQGRNEKSLPISLGSRMFRLTVRSFPRPGANEERFDFLTMGISSVEVSAEGRPPEILWAQQGWKSIPKREYDLLVKEHGHERPTPWSAWTWMFLVVGLLLGKPLVLLYGVLTAKHRIVKGMATSYSFPPATPAQFARLDVAALDRYTAELESLGFEPSLDFSLVADVPNHPPSFCRLFSHPRHHCFAEVAQIFPHGQAPLPVKWSVMSALGDGWSLSFTDRKPMAMTTLFRRPRALGVSMPLAGTAEVLDGFLKMRYRICLELQVSPLSDTRLETYIGQMQASLGEMRQAVQSSSLAKGLSRVALRRLSLLKLRPEYVWLGDYPKEAERRGLGAAIQPR